MFDYYNSKKLLERQTASTARSHVVAMGKEGVERTAVETVHQAFVEFRGDVVLTGGDELGDRLKGFRLQRLVPIEVRLHRLFDLGKGGFHVRPGQLVVTVDHRQIALFRLDQLPQL